MSKKAMIVCCVIGLIVSAISFVLMDNGIVACAISLILLLSWARCE
jgi:uncharacterized membrane protein YgaE (UPF0421/DUF939 family)